jgi:beta-galactosidase
MKSKYPFLILIALTSLIPSAAQTKSNKTEQGNVIRQRISINEGWTFFKYDDFSKADNLIYDVRPDIADKTENKVADAKPTEAIEIESIQDILKPWILPSGNDFINDPAKQHIRPEGNPGSDFPFVQVSFDDQSWEKVNLPHDWAIKGPFQTGWNSEVGGGMGRLPINGVAWYRKKIDIPASDTSKSIFLDIDGAMSYSMVWLNGHLVGGWPYGYNSYRLNLTPYIKHGGENQLAIRIDNPNHSARWYPGAGLYRNVWLTKTNTVHVGQWGSYITTKEITKTSATIDLEVTIDNNAKTDANIEVVTSIFEIDQEGEKSKKAVAHFSSKKEKIVSGESLKMASSIKLKNPKLWGPPPTQTPNLYLAVTTISQNGKTIDTYETRFGIRTIEFNPDKGIFMNGEHIYIKGVNQHHDLGALGSAFNTCAAERQLVILREMGCNAIRMAHNPPAPELLELCDRMGFLVIDEIFDSWERKKTPHDFHLIFPEWSEPDTRAFIRRDRNCPSVIIWSFGNEVGEQYTAEEGAVVAKRIQDFVKEEDPTRPTTLAMNFAKPDMELPKIADVIGLNYQGEGIRQSPEFEGTERIRTAPSYNAFHVKFPDKVILSTETASAFSSRGIYLFPVTKEISSPTRDGRGGDSKNCQVSSYELYAVDFGSSVDKVFATIDQHSFVAGEFVWNGFDYIGEPTPYYEARSSYSGIIDLAGFPKDRFYLYQSHWRPELPMAHILPHWNWAERVGEITPVHLFTSGDEAELFLNGKSLGKKKKAKYEYRLRWDDVVYEPGELKVVAYKNGKVWAEDVMKTTGEPTSLQATADRSEIMSDGKDLSFITVKITDKDGLLVPRSNNKIEFSIEGPGEIVATDNGNSMDMTAFPSHEREAFNGMALVIVRSQAGNFGTIRVSAKSAGLKEIKLEIKSK